ncbi:MAG TPA: SPOR domain-containing protein [Azonexus sp.]
MKFDRRRFVSALVGAAAAVAIAAGVVFYLNSTPLPFNKQVQTPTRADAAANSKGEPLALPGKTDAVPDPAGRPAEAKKDEKKEEKKDEKKEEPKESKVPLFLQAGSFSTAQDADNQKAKLAFMGVEAVVQQVMIQDRTLYRVRVGPFTKIDELNKVRAELAKSGIEAQLAK